MPDLLSHYALSFLISSRVGKFKYALLFALLGLLPDIDVLFRIHRWFTHSLIPLACVALVASSVILRFRRGLLTYALIAFTLYALHIVLDLLIAPTPILWPLVSASYVLRIGINGSVSAEGVTLTPTMEVKTTTTDFTPRTSLEGPLISETGVVVAVAVFAFLITETLLRKRDYVKNS